eukprot:5939994-Prymnesium_polylepis.1
MPLSPSSHLPPSPRRLLRLQTRAQDRKRRRDQCLQRSRSTSLALFSAYVICFTGHRDLCMPCGHANL